MKDDHRLQMTDLKGIRKRLLTTAKINSFSRFTKSRIVKVTRFLSKNVDFFFDQQKSSNDPSKQSFQSCGLYCGSSVATRTNFPVQCAFNFKYLPNSLHNWKKCFHLFDFQNCKNQLVIFKVSSGCCLTFLVTIFNT